MNAGRQRRSFRALIVIGIGVQVHESKKIGIKNEATSVNQSHEVSTVGFWEMTLRVRRSLFGVLLAKASCRHRFSLARSQSLS